MLNTMFPLEEHPQREAISRASAAAELGYDYTAARAVEALTRAGFSARVERVNSVVLTVAQAKVHATPYELWEVRVPHRPAAVSAP